MNKTHRILQGIAFVLLSINIMPLHAQGLDLNMPVLDRLANESIVNDHINAGENYIILPVNRANPEQVNHLSDIENQVDYWKNNYETNVIVIDISPIVDLTLSYGCLDNNGWPYEWYVSSDSLVNVSLREFSFFLLPKSKSNSINIKGSIVCSEIEQLMIEYFPIAEPLLLSSGLWSQSIKTANCQDWGVNTMNSVEDTLISNELYFSSKGRYIKEDPINGQLTAFENGEERQYLSYNSTLCSVHKAMDFDGDALIFKILDINLIDGRKHLTTDIEVVGPCGERTPWILIQGIGSNGGLYFDIENGEIKSRLICHNIDNVRVYENSDYIHLCGSVAVQEEDEAFTPAFFPNPSSSYVHVSKTFDQYEIFSLTGQRILHGRISNREIDISPLEEGMYFVRLFHHKSKRSILKKLIKTIN